MLVLYDRFNNGRSNIRATEHLNFIAFTGSKQGFGNRSTVMNNTLAWVASGRANRYHKDTAITGQVSNAHCIPHSDTALTFLY